MLARAAARYSAALGRYNRALQRRPLRTKVATGGLICSGGDLLAQGIRRSPSDDAGGAAAGTAAARGWDVRRTTVYLVLGCCWTGAFNHVYLARLGAMFPASAGLRSALAKTIFNQLLVAPLLFVPIFFVTNGAVRGWSAERTRVQLQAEYVSTVLTMWAIWFPSNFVMFALVPVPHQVHPNRPAPPNDTDHRNHHGRPRRWPQCLTVAWVGCRCCGCPCATSAGTSSSP